MFILPCLSLGTLLQVFEDCDLIPSFVSSGLKKPGFLGVLTHVWSFKGFPSPSICTPPPDIFTAVAEVGRRSYHLPTCHS